MNPDNNLNNHLSWSLKHKLIYLGVFLGALFFTVIVPLFFSFSKNPTCFDNKKNQDELGIDCGGACQKICLSQITTPIVLWSKVFRVSDGVYNALALLENPNTNAVTDSLSYTFKLKNGQGNIVTQRTGRTFVPDNNVVAIFESGLMVSSVPQTVEFEIDNVGVWTKTSTPISEIAVTSQKLSDIYGSPRLNVEIENKSLQNIKK